MRCTYAVHFVIFVEKRSEEIDRNGIVTVGDRYMAEMKACIKKARNLINDIAMRFYTTMDETTLHSFKNMRTLVMWLLLAAPFQMPVKVSIINVTVRKHICVH